jgi:hypothetical protein
VNGETKIFLSCTDEIPKTAKWGHQSATDNKEEITSSEFGGTYV